MEILFTMYDEKVTYWAPRDVPGSANQTVYEAPIEVNAKWIDQAGQMVDVGGSLITSEAVVFVDRDLQARGMLCRKPLDGILYFREPLRNGAIEIKKFAKTYTLDGKPSETAVRTAIL